jgi:hypothetical protein
VSQLHLSAWWSCRTPRLRDRPIITQLCSWRTKTSLGGPSVNSIIGNYWINYRRPWWIHEYFLQNYWFPLTMDLTFTFIASWSMHMFASILITQVSCICC